MRAWSQAMGFNIRDEVAMFGNLLKGCFGLVAVCSGIILVLGILGSAQVSGSMGDVQWLLISAGAIGGLIFVLSRKPTEQTETAIHTSPVRQRNIGQIAPVNDNIFQGHGATIELREDSIAIERQGTASFLTQGLKGEKRILFSSITAIQLKDAGNSMSGYIQFSILGGNESNRGIWDATLDENTVMFTKAQAARFHQLRDLIETKLAEARRPHVAVASQSVADEVAKLADLWSKGILTDEEFAQQKAHILAR